MELTDDLFDNVQLEKCSTDGLVIKILTPQLLSISNDLAEPLGFKRTAAFELIIGLYQTAHSGDRSV